MIILKRIIITLCLLFSSIFLVRLCLNAPNSFLSQMYFDALLLCLMGYVWLMIQVGNDDNQ